MKATVMNPDSSIEPAHTRCLAIAFTQGDPGTLDFRGDILDLRKSGVMELAGRIATAGIIHNMSIYGRIGSETGEILSLDWDQSHVMHEANRATKGECCRDPMDRLRALVGSRLGDLFRSDLKQCFGGPLGCTHINTLFQELSAAVARWQSLCEVHPGLLDNRVYGERIGFRSVFFDAFLPEDGATSELRVRLTDAHYDSMDEAGGERLFGHAEVRLAAQVGLVGWQVETLSAFERDRRGPAIGAQDWIDRSHDLEGFAGRSLGGGMAKYSVEELGAQPEDACLLSALLCLAPGMTQVGAALSDSLAPSPVARPQQSGSPLAGPGPCYMLRSEGPLMQSIRGEAFEQD